eukprot:g8185.t1
MEPRRSNRILFREKKKASSTFAETFLQNHQELNTLQSPVLYATIGHVGPVGSYPGGLEKHIYKDWYLQLCKTNMKELYEAVWGWNDDEADLQYEKEGSHFFFAFLDGDLSQPIGLCQIIIEWYYGRAVMYVYEIQVEAKHHGKRIGHHFMNILEIMGQELKLDAIVLTCMKQNERAMKFYLKLGYSVDESSPEEKEKPK